MSEASRREFLQKAGAVAIGSAAASLALGAGDAAAAGGTGLSAEEFSGLFDELFALATDPRRRTQTIDQVLRSHRIVVNAPSQVQKVLGPLLHSSKSTITRGGEVPGAKCASCTACSFCSIWRGTDPFGVAYYAAGAAAIWAIELP